MSVQLGSRVRDTLTGFTGIATGRTEWLYGCSRVSIEPEELSINGTVQDHHWFDEQRIEVLEIKIIPISDDSDAKIGGPQLDPSYDRGEE